MCGASAAAPVLVVACGNSLAGDDALAARVCRTLRASSLPAGVEILDLGANPTDLADHIEGRAALVIVDAVAAEGCRSGQLIDLAWSEAEHVISLQTSGQASTHALGLAGQLALMDRLGLLPPVVRVIGLTIAHVRVGCRPGKAVLRQLPTLVERVRSAAAQLAAAAAARRDR